MSVILVVGPWEEFAHVLAPLLAGDCRLVLVGSCGDALHYMRTSPPPAIVFSEFNAWNAANFLAFRKEFPHVQCVELRPQNGWRPAVESAEDAGKDKAGLTSLSAARLSQSLPAAHTASPRESAATEGSPPATPRPEDLMLMLAHDLRAAISVIAGYAGVLLDREGDPSPEGATMIGRIRNTCQRLIGIVDDVVRIMRAGDRGGALELAQVTPHELIHAAIEDLSGAAEARHQKIQCDVSGPNESRVVDPHLITLVLRNLIHNAVKFTRQGGEIVVKGRSEPGGLAFQVQDDGQGIAPTMQSTLFDRVKRFFPADHGTGTGIGLWSARKVVDLHGGTIWVKSAPGRGSVFGFTVRAQDEQAPGEAAPAAPAADSPAAG